MSEHLWNIWSNSLSQSFLPLTLVKFAALPRTHRDTVKAVKGRLGSNPYCAAIQEPTW